MGVLSYLKYVLGVLLLLVIISYVIKVKFWVNLKNGVYNRRIYYFVNYFIIIDMVYLYISKEIGSIFIIGALLYRLMMEKIGVKEVKFIWEYGWIGAGLIKLSEKYKGNNSKIQGMINKLVIWHIVSYASLCSLDRRLTNIVEEHLEKKKC